MLKCLEYQWKLDPAHSVPRLLLCSFRPTFKYGDNCREFMRLGEQRLPHSFCSTCKRNVMLVSKWHWVRSVDELSKHFGVQLAQLKNPVASLLNSCYWLLMMWFSKFLLQFLRVWWTFCCIWQSCQPSISLCQLSAMSIGPTHLLVFVC